MLVTRYVFVLTVLLPWMAGCWSHPPHDAHGGASDVALTQGPSSKPEAPAKGSGIHGQFIPDPFAGASGFDRGEPSPASTTSNGVIRGRVVADGSPVVDARVRLKGRAEFTTTNNEGQFKLQRPAPAKLPLRITASKVGYYIRGTELPAEGNPDPSVELTLQPLPEQDDEQYAWIDPTPDELSEHNCGNCHPTIYDEWRHDGHARSATNPRFLNLYDGTNRQGEPEQGWGLLPDYPEAAGVCTACHAPAVTLKELAVGDIRSIDGVAQHGVHCDFCHKIQDVSPDTLGMAHGRFGVKLLRPNQGQVSFGPLDDVDVGTDTHLPLQSEGLFCASCHEGTVFGVHAYSTYSEWLESPDRGLGRTCQSCHMRPTGRMTNIAPGAGGIERDPQTLATHTFMPGGLALMLRDCLELSLTQEPVSEGTLLSVQIRARRAGHRVPTGFIDRHLLLVVEGYDEQGTKLVAQDGPRLPAAADDLAGESGQLFAKMLVDAQGHGPLPFWQPAVTVQDTRLGPEELSIHTFRYPPSTARFRVRLIHRRFWRAVARQKNWPDDQIIVEDRESLVRDISERD